MTGRDAKDTSSCLKSKKIPAQIRAPGQHSSNAKQSLTPLGGTSSFFRGYGLLVRAQVLYIGRAAFSAADCFTSNTLIKMRAEPFEARC